MTARLAQVAIDAVDPEVVAAFWREVLGWQELEREGDDVICLGPPAGQGPGIDVIRTPDRKAGKNRLHLDLRADDGDTAQELERLLALGAQRADVGQPPDVSWTVLADPEGNEFCLLGTSGG